MCSMTKYAELLKDPRWQKKRLEILERDDWTCQWCGSKEKTLHVHHLCYVHGRDPWESPIHELLTVCEDCHASEKNRKTYLGRISYAFSVLWQLDSAALRNLAEHFEAMGEHGVGDPIYIYENLDINHIEATNKAARHILYDDLPSLARGNLHG